MQVPDRKIKAVGAGGIAVAPVLVWIWGMLMPEQPMPPEVAAALAGVVAMVMGYMVKA